MPQRFKYFEGWLVLQMALSPQLVRMIVSDIVTLKERGKYQVILESCVGLGDMVAHLLPQRSYSILRREVFSW